MPESATSHGRNAPQGQSVNVHERLKRLLHSLEPGTVPAHELLRRCRAELPGVDVVEIMAALRTVRGEQARNAAAETAELERQLRRLRAGIHAVHDEDGKHAIVLPPLSPAATSQLKRSMSRLRAGRRGDPEADS